MKGTGREIVNELLLERMSERLSERKSNKLQHLNTREKKCIHVHVLTQKDKEPAIPFTVLLKQVDLIY